MPSIDLPVAPDWGLTHQSWGDLKMGVVDVVEVTGSNRCRLDSCKSGREGRTEGEERARLLYSIVKKGVPILGFEVSPVPPYLTRYHNSDIPPTSPYTSTLLSCPKPRHGKEGRPILGSK
jgi:hypothetical protein